VKFARGASAAQVNGTLKGRESIDYVVRAAAGQTLRVSLKSKSNPRNYFNVLPPGSTDAAMFTGDAGDDVYQGLLPADGFLREPGTGSVLHSPFLKGIVAVIFLYGVGLGVAYGAGAGTVKSDRDVIKGMSQQMSTLGGYMVLVFFAAQFVAFFNWTNLGLILAVEGAQFLKAVRRYVEQPALLAT
jgi:hypothetical protein